MNKTKENITWFNNWATTYDHFIFRRWLWYWQRKTIEQIPPTCTSILEIACGTGIGTEQAAKRFPHADIYAMDISPEMVKIAKKRLKPYKKVHVLVGNVEKIDLKQRFDAVYCTEAFHHFSHPLKALTEIRKVTKKGGTLLITDINFPPLFLSNFLFRLEPGFVHMYSSSELEDLFLQSRFVVQKQQRIGLFALMTVGNAP